MTEVDMDTVLVEDRYFSLLQKKIGYAFNNKNLFITAFTHCSYANESIEKCPTNERLEFLGDAVLNLVATKYLFSRYEGLAEGDLTKIRSRLVDTKACFCYAEDLGLYQYIRLGKGEQLNPDSAGKKTILADLFEALVGAIYLDGGVSSAENFLQELLAKHCELTMATPCENWKAQLQEFCQTGKKKTISYLLLEESGADHQKKYIFGVYIDNAVLGKGHGNSKKQAQQLAAKEALQVLHHQFPK